MDSSTGSWPEYFTEQTVMLEISEEFKQHDWVCVIIKVLYERVCTLINLKSEQKADLSR